MGKHFSDEVMATAKILAKTAQAVADDSLCVTHDDMKPARRVTYRDSVTMCEYIMGIAEKIDLLHAELYKPKREPQKLKRKGFA